MAFIDVLFSEHNHLTNFFHLGLGQFGRFVYISGSKSVSILAPQGYIRLRRALQSLHWTGNDQFVYSCSCSSISHPCQNWKMCGSCPKWHTWKEDKQEGGWNSWTTGMWAKFEGGGQGGEAGTPCVSTCLLPISGRAYPRLLIRAGGCKRVQGSTTITRINRCIRNQPWEPAILWVRTQINSHGANHKLFVVIGSK